MSDNEIEGPVIPPESEAASASDWDAAVNTSEQRGGDRMAAMLGALARRRVVGEG